MAVEFFCIALAKDLKETGKYFVVRDNIRRLKRCVAFWIDETRQLAHRAAESVVEEEGEEENRDEDVVAVDEEEEDDDKVDLYGNSTATSAIQDASKDKVDSFRAKLAADWDLESSTSKKEEAATPNTTKNT